jgi:protein-S-isoprenylcysteine O-methyltransferase Ste14
MVVAPLFIVLFVVRTGIEERTLLAEVPRYADYAAGMGARLIPGVW